ncbi:MAG: Mevalonate kinase [Bathelium mastoideum]|nr:MAG: Mevalonate kinase [Bathelium mastoideum]
MVFFLKTSIEEERMFELQPAFSAPLRVRTLHDEGSWTPTSRFPPITPNQPCLDLRIPQTYIQPPIQENATAHASLPSVITTKPEKPTNGLPSTSNTPDLNHEVSGSTQKKYNSKISSGIEKAMDAMRITDDDSTEDGLSPMSSTSPDDQSGSNRARQSSIPLAPPFMVSAPGKVIVCGEHAVVHGKAAMAAAISLRSYLHVHTLSKSARTVSLFFPDIALRHTWSIDRLPWPAFQHPSKKRTYYDAVTALDPDLLASLQPYVDAVSPDADPHTRRIHHSTATAFLYLFLSLGDARRSRACIYSLRSTIPLGAGLGSSASVSVCLAAALLLQAHALSGPHPDQPAAEAALQRERVNRWAFVGECCIHGTPSGIDNTVATQGAAVLFQRPTVTPLHPFPTLPLWLVNTRQSRSTAAEVAKVAALRAQYPRVVEGVLGAIDGVTRSAVDLLSAPAVESSSDGLSHEALRQLGELMALNHGLLATLGVSHPRLERLRALVAEAGVGWTKLTGAGGGGCAITLLDPAVTQEGEGRGASERDSDAPGEGKDKEDGPSRLARLERTLAAEGFEKFETTLGGDGVGVLLPAVLHNGSDESGEGGEEIDQEKFLRVEGRVGLEKLVGVMGPGKGFNVNTPHNTAKPPKNKPITPASPPSTLPAAALLCAAAEDDDNDDDPPLAVDVAPVSSVPVVVALWTPPIDVASAEEVDETAAEEPEEADELGAGVEEALVPEEQEADCGTVTPYWPQRLLATAMAAGFGSGETRDVSLVAADALDVERWAAAKARADAGVLLTMTSISGMFSRRRWGNAMDWAYRAARDARWQLCDDRSDGAGDDAEEDGKLHVGRWASRLELHKRNPQAAKAMVGD